MDDCAAIVGLGGRASRAQVDGSARDACAIDASTTEQTTVKTLELRLQRYLETPGAFPFRPPGNCLERSLGVYRLLCGVNAAPELVVGFRQSAGRRMEGRVWVLVDGTAVAEPSDTVGTYTRVVTFDSAARRRGSARSDTARGHPVRLIGPSARAGARRTGPGVEEFLPRT